MEELFPLFQSNLIVSVLIEKFFYVIDVLVARSKQVQELGEKLVFFKIVEILVFINVVVAKFPLQELFFLLFSNCMWKKSNFKV